MQAAPAEGDQHVQGDARDQLEQAGVAFTARSEWFALVGLGDFKSAEIEIEASAYLATNT
jgi:hypothetical protein